MSPAGENLPGMFLIVPITNIIKLRLYKIVSVRVNDAAFTVYASYPNTSVTICIKIGCIGKLYRYDFVAALIQIAKIE